MMIVHAGAFGFYCLAIVIYYTFSLRYYLTADSTSARQMYEAWIVCEIMNVAAQLLLIVILWKLSLKV